MPAKKEYLSTPGHRALKISAGILGGYFLASAIHLLIATIIPFRGEVLLTATFTLFILWVALMILAFFAKNGWKIWGIYLLSILFCAIVIYFFKKS